MCLFNLYETNSYSLLFFYSDGNNKAIFTIPQEKENRNWELFSERQE